MDDEKVKMLMDLRIQAYFDKFLKDTLPEILKTPVAVCPHGKQISRVKWALIGAVAVLAVSVPVFGRALLTIFFKV